MKRISNTLERILEVLLVVLMAAMVLDVTWQVLTRFLLNDPSSYTEEIARFLLIWIGLMGAAYAYRKHSHLSLDLLIHKLSPQYQLWLVRIIQLVTIAFALSTMVYGGVRLMALTLDPIQVAPATNVAMGHVYSCIPLSGLLICWFALDFFLYPEQALRPIDPETEVIE